MTEKKELERVLDVGTMQEFLELSDEDMKKAETSGNRMAAIINCLWSGIQRLVDERNKEAAEVDAMKKELAEYAHHAEQLEIIKAEYADEEESRD